ncbi:MAG TPA: alanine racemase [Bacteroidales bacterium]|nr:alanine racemase [Bacteroidales bacterium]
MKNIISGIRKPVLVLDEKKCRENIRLMAGKAEKWGVNFRPHFKTHQSATIGNWFRDEGVKSITVSSVTMASFFAGKGWSDITIAFPLNLREAGSLRKLINETGAAINILTSGQEHLNMVLKKVDFRAGCFIKTDTGYRRTGVDWNDKQQLMRMAYDIYNSDSLRFKGILTHSGHSYGVRSREEAERIFHDSSEKMAEAGKHTGYDGIIISTGDTPLCSMVEEPGIFNEIRPGNFVFYDLMQAEIGSCTRDQVAVALFCPVVDRNIRRNEVLIYGGGVHLSKEVLIRKDGSTVFGEIAFPAEKGWHFPEERIFLTRITQEHGIISVPGNMINRFSPGDLVAVIPVHSCMTADANRKYLTLGGDEIDDFSPK